MRKTMYGFVAFYCILLIFQDNDERISNRVIFKQSLINIHNTITTKVYMLNLVTVQ